MAEQFVPQQQLQYTIDRYLENFKKIGRNNLTPAKMRSRISQLEKYWNQFFNGHTDLAQRIPEATRSSFAYFKDKQFDSTSAAYQTAMDHMAEILEEMEPVVSPHPSLSSTRLHADASAFSLSHLPPIKLPPFDGNYDEWEQFRDRFTTLIRENSDLNNFARMHFLSSCLKGSALDCIANISITAANFEIAWKGLTSRYDDKKRSINKHLSKLLGLSSISRESATEMQTLYDKASIAMASLKALDRKPEELWEDLVVHILVQKLDPLTRKAWEISISNTDVPPSYETLSNFIKSRTRALMASAPVSAVKPGVKPIAASRVHAATASANAQSQCSLCPARHFIHACPTFVSKNASQRRDIVKQQKRCFNCLSARHSIHECRSKYSCRVCHKRHHSMLHVDSDSSSSALKKAPSNCSSPQASDAAPEVNSLSASTVMRRRKPVLLATAWVTIRSPSGRTAVVRALLDQGSEMTFISESLAQILRLKRIRMPISVSAVGGINAGTFQHATHIFISHRKSLAPSLSTTALILKSLTSYTPRRHVDLSSLSYLSDLPRADSDPTSSDPINIIIGADLYSDIIRDGIRRGSVGQPFAQNSIFGWIISGPLTSLERNDPSQSTMTFGHCDRGRISAHHTISSPSLEEELRRFWEIEELPRQSILTPQEKQCEEHFSSTHYRDSDGRYIVRLPFKTSPPIDIGKSRFRAEKMLNSLVRRLRDKPEVAKEYFDFISEYERLGHMRPVPMPQGDKEPAVYLPHHGVIRESSSTTRLRVVFNASSVTSNGTSLNDHLHAGPKLQTDLMSVILQWRRYKYVYSCDIAKMYRQILVDPRDTNYQLILWKRSQSESLIDYQLLTVTYGMACAPFLALRVLKQLVRDEGQQFPLAVSILRDNIYVDDLLFGADDTIRIRQARDQLNSMLKRGGFVLRKWASNSPSLLEDIDRADHGLATKKPLAEDEQIKILGIGWNPTNDTFEFRVSLTDNVPETKRKILSAIAKFYDPLGWVTPVTITAKIFMQQLWRLKIDWDDVISEPHITKWIEIYSRLSHLSNSRITRWVGLGSDTNHAEIHGFADASTYAYAACVYLKTISSAGNITTTLLVGKSKVAPLKPLSIPRLELSAAVLLSRLVEFVRESNGYKNLPCYCWTDSTIVLAWVSQPPSRWKTFVANRVNDIQTRLPDVEWRHVPTEANPADCASRGIYGDEIIHRELWWQGPPWLQSTSHQLPRNESYFSPEAPLEEKINSLQCSQPHVTWDLASRYSSWPKLIRVTAYILKFISLCNRNRSSTFSLLSSQYPASRSIALSASDCNTARLFWIKKIQAELFPTEINALSKNKSLSSRSSLLSLRPFLDRDGILRVGGRLNKAPLPTSVRHPTLLSSHPLVTLIVNQTHLRALHAGPQLTLNILRRDFWILRARNMVKSVIHKCVVCARERAATPTQIMGDLPETRVTATVRCFLHCGLDYAGPVQVRASAGRGITYNTFGVSKRLFHSSIFKCLLSILRSPRTTTINVFGQRDHVRRSGPRNDRRVPVSSTKSEFLELNSLR
ncbi:uncharacterized protein [Polyergus mexicanus]|uniref:uncharacterized protein n=1 Tax=Polyergus mexicanus TaxID=615972 RepID=UPI0038B5B2C4